MTTNLSRVYLTKEARREARKRAADKDIPMVDFFDDIILGPKKKKGRGGDSFF